MQTTPTKIPGLVIVEPKVFGDDRGFFLETWQQERYALAGIRSAFVQDNMSKSRRGVLRGLHFQNPNPQGKLVSVVVGTVYDVAVDVRRGSPTFGQWFGIELSGDNKRQLYVPPGMAHGFVVTSDDAIFAYKCTELYQPAAEKTILWDDPDLAIDWPVSHPTLALKDQKGLRLRDLPTDMLVAYTEATR